MPTSPKGKLTISPVSPWLAALAYPLGRLLVLPSYFRKIEIIGQENLPKTGPVILAPTHRSRWDALIMPYATGRCVSGRDLRFMVTEDEMKGIQGWFIRRLGGFAVNPRHPSIATLRYGVELLRQGEMMVIFPEGNIFQDNEVHPLKVGLARLALQAESSQPNLNVQIVPISLHYTPIVPRWGSRVRVNIGAPLAVAHYCQGSAKQNAKHLIADLTTVLTELDRC
ncbi:MAG: lysophospholipid acyltransferase family protein [Lyngbya sp.]|nr:lysophospholipid acyltransferase family protein [Lyngbya sp.]